MNKKGIVKRSCLALMLMMVMLFAMSITASAETVAVTGLTQTDAAKTSATVSWNSSASAYLVYVNGSLVAKQTATTYKLSNMVAGTYAEVVVIGYNEPLEADAATIYNNAAQGAYGYGIVTYAYSTPGKPSDVANADYSDTFSWRPKQSNSVKVGWVLNKNATYYPDGWQVVVSTVNGKKKLKTKNVAGVRDTVISTTFNIKAVKNTGFSVKVRGYIKVNGKKKYGTWSATKVVIPQAKTSIKMNGSSNSAKISWTKIANATKYEVYVCKNVNASNPKFKKVKTLSKSKTSYTLTNMKVYQHYGVYIKATVKYGKKTYKSSITSYDELYFTY